MATVIDTANWASNPITDPNNQSRVLQPDPSRSKPQRPQRNQPDGHRPPYYKAFLHESQWQRKVEYSEVLRIVRSS